MMIPRNRALQLPVQTSEMYGAITNDPYVQSWGASSGITSRPLRR